MATMQINQQPMTFTAAAARRIQELIWEEGNYNLKLRVYITGGGCSGFQYGFAFDEKLRPDDVVICQAVKEEDEEDEGGSKGPDGVSIVVDALSIMYLMGAQIDYVENLQGAHFTVKNPNAQTTCSCGSSFSL